MLNCLIFIKRGYLYYDDLGPGLEMRQNLTIPTWTSVVDFDECLHATHTKLWLKYALSHEKCKIEKKAGEWGKMSQK